MPAIRRNTAPSTIQAGAAQIPAQRELKVRMGMSETWFADYDETIPPGSTFSAGQWAQMQIEADLLSEQTGKQYTTLEIHSINGGSTLQNVSHDRAPGSMTACIWSKVNRAILVERQFGDVSYKANKKVNTTNDWGESISEWQEVTQTERAPDLDRTSVV